MMTMANVMILMRVLSVTTTLRQLPTARDTLVLVERHWYQVTYHLTLLQDRLSHSRRRIYLPKSVVKSEHLDRRGLNSILGLNILFLNAIFCFARRHFGAR